MDGVNELRAYMTEVGLAIASAEGVAFSDIFATTKPGVNDDGFFRSYFPMPSQSAIIRLSVPAPDLATSADSGVIRVSGDLLSRRRLHEAWATGVLMGEEDISGAMKRSGYLNNLYTSPTFPVNSPNSLIEAVLSGLERKS